MKRKLFLLTTLMATIVLLTSCSKDDDSSKGQPPKQEEPKPEDPKPDDPKPKQDEIIIFQDALAESICVKNFDKNSDGKISKSEAASVSDIGTIFKKTEITSLDELQYFTNLTSIGE
jgi:major membrane immunogen (membrane-anchored lipoprotein)